MVRTVITRCTYDSPKPGWQLPMFGVSLHLGGGHTIKELIQVHLLGAFDPLPARVDLGIGRHCTHDGRSADFYLSRILDDPFQGHSYISASFIEQCQCVSMAVDGVSADVVL